MKIARDKIHNYVINNKLDIEKIMQDYNRYIYTIIANSKMFFSKEDIEEIIADVYLVLWNNQKMLDINKSMSAYIAGVTKNLILKVARNNKQIESIEKYEEQLVSIQNIELDYLENQRRKAMINELKKMKKQDQEIFILYYYEQRKVKEIAIIFDMSESKVKSKLFRIRKKLSKVLKKGGYDNYEWKKYIRDSQNEHSH